MNEILAQTDFLIVLLLFVAGALAFIISTISGGGGALLLVPVLKWFIGASNTAPVLNLGNFIGRPARLIIFWKHIQWRVCLYYVPSALAGAVLAAYFFKNIEIKWLELIIALFLISTVFQYNFGKKERSFKMRWTYFIPLGFLVSVLSTLVGALGPVLNPFYLNAGIDKEELIATKTANSFFMGIAQIGSYTFFGLLHGKYWIYGIALGLGATLGNILGKYLLAGMSSMLFRRLLIILMMISGIVMIIQFL